MRKRENNELKPSGIEWIGNIPVSWNYGEKLGLVINIVSGFPFPSDSFNFEEKGYPLVRIRDIIRGYTETYADVAWEEKAAVNHGDILVGMDGDFNVAIWQSKPALLNQRACKVEKNSSGKIHNRFMYYALPSHLKVINDLTYATTVKHLSTGDIKAIKMPIPPLVEQQRIASFLDQETSKIDSLADELTKFKANLQLQKRSLVSECVTKGIPSERDRDFRDSELPWVDKLPVDFTNMRLGYIVKKVKKKTQDSDGIITAFRDGEVTLRSNRRTTGFTEATDFSNYQHIDEGDLVIHSMDAFAGCVGVSDSTGMGSSVLMVCQTERDDVYIPFVAFVLKVMAMNGHINSLNRGTRERSGEFRWNQAKDQVIPMPSLEEQTRIVNFIEKENARIDALIGEIDNQVNLLKTYRKSLINEVVTGKVEV